MAFHITVFDQLLSSLKQLDFEDIVSKHHEGAKPRKFDQITYQFLELLNPEPEPPQEAENERLPLLNFCTGQ